MYTMVLMMAVTSGGDVSSFGHHRNGGCNGGGASCSGYVVAAPTSCNGSFAPAGYAQATGCNGGSCHGAKKGFLGGLFGHHRKNSGGSCHGGAVVAVPDCGGCPPVVYGGPQGPVTGGTTPPVIMPKVEDPKVKPKTEDKPKTEAKPKTESN